ncbi:MAG: efflux transporter outer membrane subunit [Magnetococcales bacterium]|nr:efflux transporter outer membrane subunit [Magnetococcales bacterium]
MNKLTPALVLLPLLWGCTLVPAFQHPAPPIHAQWPQFSPSSSPTEGLSASEMAWTDFFQSEPLQEVIRTALIHNRDWRMAVLNVKAAQALYQVEKADQWPSIDAGASAERVGVTRAQNGGGSRSISSSYSANVAITAFELDLFGRISSQNEAALQRYFSTVAAQDAARISLIAEVANTYLQWLADRKILALVEETLKTQSQTYELIRQSYERGAASKLDVSQIHMAVETARANHALYNRQVLQTGNALKQLMGTTTLSAEGHPTLESVSLTTVLPVGLPSEVLLQRPDIRQAEHALQAAHADIGVARAAFFPQISLTAGLGFASPQLSNLFSSQGSGAWRFIPQFNLPLFDNGSNQANLEYSQTSEEILIAAYEKAIQNAFREVADALAARYTLENELSAQRDLVAASQEAYDLSFARYKGGIDSFLNVLDAQRSLFAAQQRYITVEKQRLANQVTFYKSLGGGLK